MIAYTMVGTTDLERARRFHDPLFAELGQDLRYRDESVASWGSRADDSAPRFFTGYPFDGNPAGVGNGAMTAFLVPDAGKIDRLFDIALRNGGSSERRPGPRPRYGDGFYAAYVRDPDGNKTAFVCYDYRAP